MVKLLLKANSSPSFINSVNGVRPVINATLCDREQCTPFILAARRWHFQAVKMLAGDHRAPRFEENYQRYRFRGEIAAQFHEVVYPGVFEHGRVLPEFPGY
jgi:hypothetical protein